MKQHNENAYLNSDFKDSSLIKEHLNIRKKVLIEFKKIFPEKIVDLIAFHRTHKYLLMSYNPIKLKELGTLAANKDKLNIKAILNKYLALLIEIFEKRPTEENQLNTLFHMYGYFKNMLNSEMKKYYFLQQNAYANKKCSFSNILSLLRTYTIQFQETYLLDQKIFELYLD